MLNQSDYLALDTQYARTPPLEDGSGVSGEHWNLMHLLNQLGFKVLTREAAMDKAEQLLAEGYQ